MSVHLWKRRDLYLTASLYLFSKWSGRYFNIGYDHNGMTFDLNCLSPCIFEKVNESISSCNPLPLATWTIITRRTNMKKKTRTNIKTKGQIPKSPGWQIWRKNRTNIKKQQDKYQNHQEDKYEEKNRTNIKHCQRHNGPEGWVHITSSKQNLDQVSSSESRPRINFITSTKHQRKKGGQTPAKNLAWTSTSISWLNLVLKVWTKV